MHSNRSVVVALMAAATLGSTSASADGPAVATNPPADGGTPSADGSGESAAPTTSLDEGNAASTEPAAGETQATPTPTPAASTPPATTTSHATAVAAAAPVPEDDGRQTDVLFVQGEGGVSYVDLTAVSSQGRLLPSLTEFRGTGYGGGLTVGMRASIIALAAHAYVTRFEGEGANRTNANDPSTSMPTPAVFDLGQVMLEAQLRLPVPVIEPYARIGLGYAWMGAFQINEMYRNSTSGVQGFTGKLGVGADLWIAKVFTVGIGVDFTLLNLRRDGVMREDSACPQTMPTCVELRMDGDAVGMMTHFHAQAGLHF